MTQDPALLSPRATATPPGDVVQARARVVVFLTRGMSLAGWREAGIFDREIAFYRAMRRRVGSLALVSYGGRAEEAFRRELGSIEILPNRWRLSANLYSLVAPLLHRRAIAQASALKTHQLNGAWAAAIAKRLFGTRLVVRCGYIWSAFLERESRNPWRRRAVRALEGWVLRVADRVLVATEQDHEYLLGRYRLDPGRLEVIPNYVDVALFRPRPEIPRERGLIGFVGRLDEQKDPLALIEAMRGIPGARLLMVGDGPLRAELQRKARERHLSVEFAGRVAHERLPELLNRVEVFVLSSRYEGNPKAMLEAMACGLPVIGTKVPGIENLLVHGRTGYLCEPRWQAIHAAIVALLDDGALRQRLGHGARDYVEQHCSLDRIIDSELAALVGEPAMGGRASAGR